MKITRLSPFVALVLASFQAIVIQAASSPRITSVAIQRTNILVRVSVPAGLKKVTLQSRGRALGSVWEPRAVNRFNGSASVETEFTIPISAKVELIQVQADSEEALPAAFYSGTNNFTGAAGATGVLLAPGATDLNRGGAEDTAPRDVVESDIWNLRGDTLYFFNQYRGLQVIDVTQPGAPKVQGTLALPASGEQMYMVNDRYALLLARNSCGWGGSNDDSSAVLVNVSDPHNPQITAMLSIPGYIQESRMVGTALYVASQAYRPRPTETNTWEWGSTITSFDLSDAARPARKDSIWYSGYGNVIQATDRYLFLATTSPTSWYESILRILDISKPDGSMTELSKLGGIGQVPDKFKMNLNGDVFTVISQKWDDKRRWTTTLQTFSLKDPAAPAALGKLELAAGEQLHATRFDGNLVYVVTFLRVDPLWIVDLADPANPKISGELQVPGWSTYIHPLEGQKLLTVGIDNTNGWKVAVSLFDVQDRTKPALLSKVSLGENYSWSEANNDEKAFGVFPSAGLVLAPYQGNTTNGYASRVQLIDLGADKLTLRGAIDHAFQPRRATLTKGHILSISGRELISVDAANRDNPAVKADVELSWSVSKILLSGNYLLEVDQGDSWSWNGAVHPKVRVANRDGGNEILTELELTAQLPIVGSVLQDGLLYVVQAQRGWGPLPMLVDATDPAKPVTNPPVTMYLTVADARSLPKLSVLGQTSVAADYVGWGANLQALWPKPGVLVWAGGGGGGMYWWGPVDVVGVGGVMPGRFWNPWYYGGNSGQLFAFDVKDAAAPKFASQVNLTTNSWWNFSPAFTSGSLVLSSHQSSEFVEGLVIAGQPQPAPTVTVDKETGETVTNRPPVGTWMQKYYLDVVDFGDPSAPLVRKSVNIPGLLKGISANGALLYTVAPHWGTNLVTDGTEWLDASAYDGVAAFLVDSLPLKDWPHPVVVSRDRILIGRATDTNATGRLETWSVNASGKLALAGSVALKSSPQTLVDFGSFLVAQGSELSFFDLTQAGPLGLAGLAPVDVCYYFDLRQGDGRLDLGFWAPMADFGVKKFEIQK